MAAPSEKSSVVLGDDGCVTPVKSVPPTTAALPRTNPVIPECPEFLFVGARVIEVEFLRDRAEYFQWYRVYFPNEGRLRHLLARDPAEGSRIIGREVSDDNVHVLAEFVYPNIGRIIGRGWDKNERPSLLIDDLDKQAIVGAQAGVRTQIWSSICTTLPLRYCDGHVQLRSSVTSEGRKRFVLRQSATRYRLSSILMRFPV